jgi:hypothetical protein
MTTITSTTSLVLTSVTNESTTILVYENANVVGNCTSVYHVIPDTVEEIIHNSSTTVISATEEIFPASTYSTSSYANYTSTFVVTSTSVDQGAEPSDGWFVSTCTYTR